MCFNSKLSLSQHMHSKQFLILTISSVIMSRSCLSRLRLKVYVNLADICCNRNCIQVKKSYLCLYIGLQQALFDPDRFCVKRK